MNEAYRFPIFILVSLVVFFGVLSFVTRKRSIKPSLAIVLISASVVVVGGMIFAKFGQNAGWPWWIYYTIPALVTLLVPPVVLRFSAREILKYLALAALSSPVIHIAFSFLLGWHDYMPFFRVPSLQELLSIG